MTEEERIFSGLIFDPTDAELRKKKLKAHRLNQDYNNCYEDETEKRGKIIHELVGEVGHDTFFQGPVTFHYGSHTKVGSNSFFNFNLTVQDDAPVTIGDWCDFGPNVTIVTPVHPLLAEERQALLDADDVRRRVCYAKPVSIGNHCWIGANAVICPGVNIGDNCVIGAGSVVTRDIPAGSLAVGVPCKVLRKLTEKDSVKHMPERLGGYH